MDKDFSWFGYEVEVEGHDCVFCNILCYWYLCDFLTFEKTMEE